MICSDLIYNFYNYQFRKDLIDKFNISCISDIDLPIHITLTQRYRIRRHLKKRAVYLLRARLLFETVSNQACFVRKLKRHSRVKSKTRLLHRHFYYFFKCDIRKKNSVFNYIGLLICILNCNPKSNFFFYFRKIALSDICVLRRLRYNSFFFLPKRMRHRSKRKMRVSFNIDDIHFCRRRKIQIIFRSFLKRLGVIRKIRKIESVKCQIIY